MEESGEGSESKFGGINVLVNNAGVLGPVTNTVDITPEKYQQVFDVNSTAVFLGMQAVIPSMEKQGGGSIVNISSTAGLVANVGMPNLAYVGSKFAVRGVSK